MKAFSLELTPAESVAKIGKSHTHILWSLGHLLWSYEVATGAAIGLVPQIPASYTSLFAFSGAPTDNAADYPSVAELTAQVEASAKRLAEKIASLSDADLAQPLPAAHPLAPFFPNIDALLAMMPFHTGYHVGQIGLLRRALGLPGVMMG